MSTHHPSVGAFSKWSPPTVCTTLNPAPRSSFNHFPCNFPPLTPSKTLLPAPRCSFRMMLLPHFHPHRITLVPPTSRSLFTGCCRLFVVRFKILRAQTPVPQGQGYALVTAGHLVFLCLHIFPHGHHSSSFWVPEGGMTLPPWPPVVHHFLKTCVFKHLHISGESFFPLISWKITLWFHFFALIVLLFLTGWSTIKWLIKLDGIVRVHSRQRKLSSWRDVLQS